MESIIETKASSILQFIHGLRGDFLAAAAQNIKRLVRFLSQVPRPLPTATT